VSVISQAINEIKNSKKFVRFLEVVLKIGNMINAGSARGGAYGFKLDTLGKVRARACYRPQICASAYTLPSSRVCLRQPCSSAT
jgi:hypothetical protein